MNIRHGQEKVHPQALVELLRDTAKASEKEPELTLFDDFNGSDELENVDFYGDFRHRRDAIVEVNGELRKAKVNKVAPA